MVSRKGILRTALVLIVLSGLVATGVRAQEYQRTFRFDSEELVVANLIGAVTVAGGSQDGFEVVIDVRGEDATADLLEFEVAEGREGSLTVVFPVDEHDRYRYPELGRGSSTISVHRNRREDGSWLKKVFSGLGGDRIRVSGRRSGLAVWADMTITVPEGRSLSVTNGVGTVTARNIDGDLLLDTSSGAVEVETMRGDLVVDTGSGAVKVDDVRGNVLVDTGSGGVTVTAVRGNLNVDTGSGGVTARRIEADEAKIDTGSGSVVLELDRMGRGEFIVDTGSGGVELVLPNDASARIEIETGSGGIRNRIENAQIRHKDRGELRMTVGDGAARVHVDTGSGGVEISMCS